MPPETNAALYRRFVEGALNQGDRAVIDALITDTYTGYNPFRVVRGPRGMASWVTTYRRAFPDLRFEIEDLIEAGDKVVARLSFTGTHAGDFLQVRATNRKVNGSGITITQFVEGKFVKSWAQWDYLGLLQQMGIAMARVKED